MEANYENNNRIKTVKVDLFGVEETIVDFSGTASLFLISLLILIICDHISLLDHRFLLLYRHLQPYETKIGEPYNQKDGKKLQVELKAAPTNMLVVLLDTPSSILGLPLETCTWLGEATKEKSEHQPRRPRQTCRRTLYERAGRRVKSARR